MVVSCSKIQMHLIKLHFFIYFPGAGPACAYLTVHLLAWTWTTIAPTATRSSENTRIRYSLIIYKDINCNRPVLVSKTRRVASAILSVRTIFGKKTKYMGYSIWLGYCPSHFRYPSFYRWLNVTMTTATL